MIISFQIFKGCLPQILFSPFLNTLYHVKKIKKTWIKNICRKTVWFIILNFKISLVWLVLKGDKNFKSEPFYNLGQNCWDKIKSLFFSKKTPLASNQCCLKSFRLLTTKLYQTQHWFGIWKTEALWNLLDF